MNKIIISIFILLWVAVGAMAQTATVTGMVTDDMGPVIGATVTVQGTSIGATTDLDGKFTLTSVPNVAKAVLIVRYVGMEEAKEPLKGRTSNINIHMKEAVGMLDDVVVIGYGTQKRGNLTGSIASVSGKILEKVQTTSAAEAIVGKLPGVQVTAVDGSPDAEIKILVRGGGSITQDNSPLIILDGFEVSSLNDVPPTDIESIEVLKDAASTAIYGARGANGVILVTTKRPVEGRVVISLNTYVQTKELSNKLDVMDPYEFVLMQYENARQKSSNPTAFNNKYGHAYEHYIYQGNAGTDWQDEVFGSNPVAKYVDLSVNGGTEKTRYLASVNYMNQEGIVKNNGVSRFSARLNLDQELSEYVSFGLTATYSQNKYDNVPLGDNANEYSGVLTGAIQSNPTIPIYDSEGNYFIDPKRPFVANPVSLLDIKDNTVKDRIIGSAFVSVKPLKDLEVKLQLGVDRSFQKRSSYLPKTTLQGKTKNGRADISQETSTAYLMELTAQYSKSFGDHNVKAIGGYSFQKFKNDGLSAGNEDFLVDGFGYNSLGSGNYKKPSVGSWASINSIASLFARANYSYKGRYLLEATVRADAASNFAPENRWGYFPSVSAGWMISEENFMKGASNWLSMLKLRTSYGQTGNSNVGYRIYDYYEVGRSAIIGGAESTGVYASDLGNRSLTWETTTEFNVGVDLGILNNRFKLTAEYFKRKITDLLVTNKPLPFYNEINKIAGNIGSTQSQGVEITVNTVNIVTKDFEWDTTLTLSHYNDRWLTRDPNWKPKPYEKENDPIRAWWEYEALGILQPGEKVPDAQKDLVPGMMKLKDRDGNGVLGDEDKVYMGNGDPKIIYGLNNSFRYKNFDLNIYFYGEAGRKRGASYYEGWTRMDNGINVSTYALKAFNSNNLTATDPTFVRGGSGWGDYYVKSIYYVRCGSITLGYKVPISQKIAKNLRVYVDVNNPFVITNWTGLDPETDNGTYAYPNVTSYNFGVSISF